MPNISDLWPQQISYGLLYFVSVAEKDRLMQYCPWTFFATASAGHRRNVRSNSHRTSFTRLQKNECIHANVFAQIKSSSESNAYCMHEWFAVRKEKLKKYKTMTYTIAFFNFLLDHIYLYIYMYQWFIQSEE